MFDTFIYLKNFITDRYVASVTPTSRSAVEKVCEKLGFEEQRLIVEYGPGTGVFTANLLKNMNDSSRLIAIERNPNFCRILGKDFLDPRLKVFNDCAGNILGILKKCRAGEVDYIISGIPFSFLSLRTKMRILKNAHSALKEGGKFLAYQHFFQLPEYLKIPLERIFHNVSSQYILQAIPPLVLFEAVKNNGNSGGNHHPKNTAI
jgi:phospholipid N-methyltransferase